MESVSIHRERVDRAASFPTWLGISRSGHRAALRHCPYLDGHLLCGRMQICDRQAPASFVWLALRWDRLFGHEFHRSAALWSSTAAAPLDARLANQRSSGPFSLHRTNDVTPDAQDIISRAELAPPRTLTSWLPIIMDNSAEQSAESLSEPPRIERLKTVRARHPG